MRSPRHITPDMVATARERIAAGDSLKLAAAHLEVDQSALGYHLRGGKATRVIGRPWVMPLRAARKAIGAGNHAEAAYHLKQAAEILIKL